MADLQLVPHLTHKSGKIVHFPIIMNFESLSISKFQIPTSQQSLQSLFSNQDNDA